MDTSKLKKFAQFARRNLMAQVGAKLESVLADGAAARREHPEAMKKLDAAIANDGKAQVIERVAYIWFNRFSALRFMDVNDLNPVRVVSPQAGQFQPEILAEAKAGSINEDRVPEKVRAQIASLLDGRTLSPDAQAEAYRLLLVAICNDWHKAMPFLFERIDDFTELLLPDDLLSNSSILAYLREAMTPDACEDVEVIGWLYQFYISEKKDDVFAGLKKNIKITAENIPAATQLFTPHWIVRYLVENSLGRLWMLNRPESMLATKMDYFIAPEEPEKEFLRIVSPEDIKVCDPACGSGHMLTYAFDLLHTIYEEEGYDAAEIPTKILTHNLYGIEIDERAGALAGFALVMKAAGKRKQFLRRPTKPHICVLENVNFEPSEIAEYARAVPEIFTNDLRETLNQFTEAKNFGSLIRPSVCNPAKMLQFFDGSDDSGNLFLRNIHERVKKTLRMADYLSSKYHVVLVNPPYINGNGMNPRLLAWCTENFEEYKSDLFAAFVIRACEISLAGARIGMMTPMVWMFILSHQNLRNFIINKKTLSSLVQLEYSGFDGATVPICTFTLENTHKPSQKGSYIRLVEFRGSDNQAPKVLEAIRNPKCGWFYRASADDFREIPGSPIAYWVPPRFVQNFSSGTPLSQIANPRKGMVTADNSRFIRYWSEVSLKKIGFNAASRTEARKLMTKWFPYMKGGSFRRWAGNSEFLINWENDGYELLNMKGNGYKTGSTNHNIEYIFKPAITWTKITSSDSGFRSNGIGFLFDDASGLCPTNNYEDHYRVLALLNSPVVSYTLRALNPTLNLNPGNLADLPVIWASNVSKNAERCEEISRGDWDASENSWDFKSFPLLSPDIKGDTLAETYSLLRTLWRNVTSEMQLLEGENNRIIIDAYGLHNELNSDVRLKDITLTCNPLYRYGGQKTLAELEETLRADTMREFLSYGVGCIFGRYSLDAPGLILASQHEGLDVYLAQIPNPSFAPDRDNVVPMLDGDWFGDDIAERFRKFLRVTFGEARFPENLAFIETALGKNGKPRALRDYFVKDFFNDHVKRYKKRPIYWLFSSPKGTFNALIYMHRYRPETVNTLLNEYLRPFRSKLEAYKTAQDRLSISADATQAQRTAALKEVQTVTTQIAEIDAWERDVIYPLATKRIEIELDDGVKANYPKFAGALKPIKGLEDADD